MKQLNTLIVAVSVVLSACTTTSEVIRVAKTPEPPLISQPHLEIYDLTKDSTPDAIVKAYYASVLRLQAAFDEARAALDAYRSK